MYCPKCGTNNNDGVNYCMKCGYAFKTVQNFNMKKANNKGKKTGEKVAIGCGLALAIPALIIGFFLFIIFMFGEDTDQNSSPDTENATQIEEKTTERITDEFLIVLMEEGLSKNEAEEIKQDFLDVGIEDLKKLTEFDGAQVTGMRSFEYSSSKFSGTLILKDNTTDYIDCGTIILFDNDKGGALDDINRYYLSDDDKASFLFSAEELVKQSLKSPSTADFPNWYSGDWSIGRKDDVVTIISYVDAQNSFGAMIRSKFAVQYSYSSGTLLYFEFDGEVVYGTARTGE